MLKAIGREQNLLGERPSAWALVGGLVILGTIGWYTLGPDRRVGRL